jgi:hypothetical protein
VERGIVGTFRDSPGTAAVPASKRAGGIPVFTGRARARDITRARKVRVEPRLVPVNAILDLALADGLNPAPLAAAGWAVAALEVPARVGSASVVCDVVLFNARCGHLLAVEAKSGANLEPEQGRKLMALTPQLLVIAGGITVPRPVPLQCEVLYACLAENADRICMGADEAGLSVPVLAVGKPGATLLRAEMASPLLSAALGAPVTWTYPIARLVPFDHESPAEAFDQPVRAELIAAMAQQRSSVTIRALTEQAVRHFPIYGRAAQGRLQRAVRDAARRAADAEPERFRYERSTGATDERVAIIRSPEAFDRRGRTQGYQAVWSSRAGRALRRPEIPGQMDLFSELDEAERIATEEESDNGTERRR